MKRVTKMLLKLTAVVIVLGGVSHLASAAEWGSIKGRFVYDGKVPQAKPIVPTKDPEYCSMFKILDEELVIDKKGGLANVILFLYPKRGQKLAIHPDYEKTAKDKVFIDNNGCRFEPHVILMRMSQQLVLKNSDQKSHNTNVKFISNRRLGFNEIIPIGQQVPKALKFAKPERLPAPVSCGIHPWMNAHLLVLDHPYAAVSAKDGSFEIKNLPAGEHEFILWHEAKGYVGPLTMGKSKAKSSKRGRVKIKVLGGDKTLDMGDIKVAPRLLGQ